MTDTPKTTNQDMRIELETRIEAPIDAAFDAILEEMGPGMATPDGTSMKMKLEAMPGGRWFRDLGDGNGHLWGHVQAIRRPTLLEICGPLFMSAPTSNNVQFRLEEKEGGTTVRFVHAAFGPMPEDLPKGMEEGWADMLQEIRKIATGS